MEFDESQKQMEVIAETRKESKTVHFASLMDLVVSQIRSWHHDFKNTNVALCSDAT